MIKKVYFWDGKLSEKWPIPEESDIALTKIDTRVAYVDAAYGLSFNESQLEYFKVLSNVQFIVVTNQPITLSFRHFNIQDSEDAKIEKLIYLFSRRNMCWMPIESFTSRELRVSHNLEHLYKAGEFIENN